MKFLCLALLATATSLTAFAQTHRADRACRIFLGDAQVECARGKCTLYSCVFVNRDFVAAVPEVLARYAANGDENAGSWLAFKSSSAPTVYGNYMRYEIAVFPNAADRELEFIPFVQIGEKTWYDHNILQGAEENYSTHSGPLSAASMCLD